MKRISFCILFLLSIHWISAQDKVGDSVILLRPLHFIYANDFDEFEKSNRVLQSKDKYAHSLLAVFAMRWKEIPVVFSKSSEAYHQLLLTLTKELEAEKHTAQTPIITYYKICAYMLLSEYHFILGENWSTLRYSQKAYPLMSEVFSKNYTQPEFLFVKGLYSYYIEHFRQKNLFYRTALLPFRSGSKKKGIELLQSCINQKSLVRIEAEIYLAHILLHFENRPTEALSVSRKLANEFPANLKFSELLTDNLIRCGQYKEALPLVRKSISQHAIYFSGPAHYFKGIIEEEFYKNISKSKEEYEKCIKIEYGPIDHYKRLATQRLKKL